MNGELRVKAPTGFQWGGIAWGDVVLMVDKKRDLVARFDLVNGYRLFKNYAAGAEKWVDIGTYSTVEDLERDLECNKALSCNLFAADAPCPRTCGLCRYFDKANGKCQWGMLESLREDNVSRLLELGFRKVNGEDRYSKFVDIPGGLEIRIVASLGFMGKNCVSVEIMGDDGDICLVKEEAPSKEGIDGLLQRAREEAGRYLKEIAAKVAEAFGNGKTEGEEGNGKVNE